MSHGDNLDELLMSQDELGIVCRTAFEVILDQGLQPLLDRKLEEAGVAPGFAGRASDIQERFSHERKKLIARGAM